MFVIKAAYQILISVINKVAADLIVFRHRNVAPIRGIKMSLSLCLSAEDNQPYLSVPCSDHKITSAVWGPLGEFVNAGHENGEINQFSAKV